jgi:hypothetical protein
MRISPGGDILAIQDACKGGLQGMTFHHNMSGPGVPHRPAGKSGNLFRARYLARRARRRWGQLRRLAYRLAKPRWVRRTAWTLGSFVTLSLFLLLGLWWRLGNGPIELDLATPWLASAIEENFGTAHAVTVGGTQIERDETGRMALRMRDIVVRDADGVVVASAPKAEVGLQGSGLLSGRVRAQSLNLVGAEMAVRIETDGKVTVFAGANSRPIATAPAAPRKPVSADDAGAPTTALRSSIEEIGGLLAWIDGLGASGLDGHDLRELGLKNGNLAVDDQRTGKHWTFSNINVSLTRPATGGVIFRLASDNLERQWQVSAALRPLEGGVRAVGLEARKVSASDLLLALRFGEGVVESDLPLSASLRGEFGTDGVLQSARGQIIAEAGYIRDPQGSSTAIQFEHADIRFTWDGPRRTLVVPFQIKAGGTQVTLVGRIEPAEQSRLLSLDVLRGDPVSSIPSFFHRVACLARKVSPSIASVFERVSTPTANASTWTRPILRATTCVRLTISALRSMAVMTIRRPSRVSLLASPERECPLPS